jgi:GABA permease
VTELLTPTENGTCSARATPPASELRSGRISRRVLLVVDDACTARDLCADVPGFARHRPIEALVLAPAHDTATHQWYVDEDAARADATRRLRTCVNCLSRDGIRASGELGDPDPLQAIADALHEFPADEILLVSAPQRPSGWLRQNVIDRARATFPQPITHIAMPAVSERSEA